MADNKPSRKWDERYGASEYVFGTKPNDFLKAVAGKIPPASKILCLADGEGRNGVYLAGLGHTVTSIDLSAVGLEKANQLAEQNGVAIKTVAADLAEYDFGTGAWDCIVSIFFHISPELRANIYPRIIQALSPGGLLILESYTPEQLNYGTGGPPFADHMLTEEELRERFSAMQVEHLEQLERDVVEGFGHTGLASVVQLTARR